MSCITSFKKKVEFKYEKKMKHDASNQVFSVLMQFLQKKNTAKFYN